MSFSRRPPSASEAAAPRRPRLLPPASRARRRPERDRADSARCGRRSSRRCWSWHPIRSSTSPKGAVLLRIPSGRGARVRRSGHAFVRSGARVQIAMPSIRPYEARRIRPGRPLEIALPLPARVPEARKLLPLLHFLTASTNRDRRVPNPRSNRIHLLRLQSAGPIAARRPTRGPRRPRAVVRTDRDGSCVEKVDDGLWSAGQPTPPPVLRFGRYASARGQCSDRLRDKPLRLPESGRRRAPHSLREGSDPVRMGKAWTLGCGLSVGRLCWASRFRTHVGSDR